MLFSSMLKLQILHLLHNMKMTRSKNLRNFEGIVGIM